MEDEWMNGKHLKSQEIIYFTTSKSGKGPSHVPLCGSKLKISGSSTGDHKIFYVILGFFPPKFLDKKRTEAV